MSRNVNVLMSAVSLTALAGSAFGQTSGATAVTGASQAGQPGASVEIQEVVVTAQKRSDRLLDVPISINAATGTQLKAAGVESAADLQKIVPGFTAVTGATGNPVFFIRGIGFNDVTLGVAPAVALYIDQQPFSFTPMARGAVLDLERVEVLKGPQGTLFGENSTGGAINFIAAKPTEDFRAGFDVTYGRFGEADAEGFVSGPVSDKLSVRAALRSENSSDWQAGYGPGAGERLGDKRFLNGRLSALWKPTNNIIWLITASAWRDRSDAQQPQEAAYTPVKTGPAAYNPFPAAATFPTAPNDDRAAGWAPGLNYKLDNWLYSLSSDLEVDLGHNLQLASLTSYDQFHQSVPQNQTGNIYQSYGDDTGKITTFSQELRLNGIAGSNVRWMVGGNYKYDDVREKLIDGPFYDTSGSIAGIPFNYFNSTNNQKVNTYSVFGSVDFKINDQLTLQGSTRYTEDQIAFAGCDADSGNDQVASGVGAILHTTIPAGHCVNVTSAFTVPSIITGNLNQDNDSYRLSLNWKPTGNALIYANVTKGYKAGSFPTIPGIFASQLAPVGQESLLAYEVGTKFKLGYKVEITGAGFYYDYKDKQLDGYKADAVFGILPALVSIPKSHVDGAEVSLAAGPYSGFSFSLNGTYIDTRVDSNPPNPTGPFGNAASFVGQPFPLTPKWQGTASADYRTPISPTLTGYVGANVSARTGADASLLSGVPATAASEALLKIKGYALVDLRAGIETSDKKWRVELWGRNITDQFYTMGTQRQVDYVTRYTGMPQTYGVTVHHTF